MVKNERLKFIYLEFLNRFGKPDGYFTFKPDSFDNVLPADITVFYWLAGNQRDTNVFCTLGMSALPMSNGELAEMNLTVHDNILDEDQIIAFCRFLANFSVYPFIHAFALRWWNLVVGIGRIPVYPNSNALLVQPKFSDDKFKNIEMGEEIIKFFNIVPLTKEETKMVETGGITMLFDYVEANHIDLFHIR